MGTITNDDLVSITINDVSVPEGNTGTSTATFTVTLSNPSSSNVTVTWQTSNGTATAGSDYAAVAPTVLTFTPGQTSKTVAVTINGDTTSEPDETFNVNLTSPGPAGVTIADAQGVGTLIDGDPVSISINDVSVTEGNSGTATATLTVTLSTPSSTNVTVTAQTANGTATAGSDYVAVAPAVLTFTPGQTTKTVSVSVNGDTIDEPNETILVNLTSPTGGSIGDPQGVITIVDDDPTPSISIGDAGKLEGNSGTSTLSFTVTLSNPSSSNVTVTWATANNTATAPSDYVAVTATVLTILAGQTTATLSVILNGDTTGEPNETFFVNLTSPTNATISDAQAVGTIQNDDTPTLVAADFSVSEGSASDPVLTVTLTSPASGPVTVNYATANALALSTTDYVTTSGTLTFAAGETSKTITLPLRRDTLPEFNEVFTVNFSSVSGAFLPVNNPVKVTITDDDQVTWNLYGDASGTTIPGCITLSQVGNGRGAAYNFKTFPLTDKFDMLFRVGFGIYDADGGAGMVFTLRKEGSLILGGSDMGYQSISPSVGVEMDTDPTWIADPNYDHMAVVENGSTSSHYVGPVQASAASENIEDGFEHTFRVKRDPVAQRLDAYFDGSQRLSYFRDITNQVYGGVSTTYFGMTASSACNSSTCPNNVLYYCPVAICIGDTATPHVLIDDVQVSEGNTGNQTATFTVSLYCPRSETVTVNYATANGTATAGLDYLAASGVLTFAPGETQKTVAVTVYPDTTSEADETFTLNLSSPSSNLATPDAQAVATIVDDVRFGFGQAGDIAIVGDWNGDGVDTPGVFRGSTGTFYLRNSNTAGAADITFSFGVAGDRVGGGRLERRRHRHRRRLPRQHLLPAGHQRREQHLHLAGGGPLHGRPAGRRLDRQRRRHRRRLPAQHQRLLRQRRCVHLRHLRRRPGDGRLERRRHRHAGPLPQRRVLPPQLEHHRDRGRHGHLRRLPGSAPGRRHRRRRRRHRRLLPQRLLRPPEVAPTSASHPLGRPHRLVRAALAL